jgi:LPS-assembly protein
MTDNIIPNPFCCHLLFVTLGSNPKSKHDGKKQVEKIIKTGLIIAISLFFCTKIYADESVVNLCRSAKNTKPALTMSAIADALGWVQTNENRCGGYYLEAPFVDASYLANDDQIKITGNQGSFSLHGTSALENVTISKEGQQIVTDMAYVYRDPQTEDYSSADLIGNVMLREPNSLVLASCGHVDLKSNEKSLQDILYRTAIYGPTTVRPAPPLIALQEERKVYQLSAWGGATSFHQEKPRIYQFTGATYSTCPPLLNTWQIRGENIELNKETGRGVAKHAKLYVKGIPILYAPYLNFPIDSRRQTGFLWPTVGTSSVNGPYFSVPYYLNLAPNYDATITPAVLSKRGIQLNNLFRYLAPQPFSNGQMQITILPNDQLFKDFKNNQEEDYQNTTNPVTLSELHRLENSWTTRVGLYWHDKTYFNEHWSGDIDYNFVSDDYYLNDFSNGLNQITPNQLLQQGDLYYKGEYWNFTGRIQAYQTLHPLEEYPFFNQYIRLPQLLLSGDFPDEKRGFNYSIANELTRFDIAKNPGNLNPGGLPSQPIGVRMHTQPGINYPIYRPAYFIDPRLQFALSKYEVTNVLDDNSTHPDRALPIFDVHGGLFFDRDFSLFKHAMRQTLEPQFYYAYVPYRNQDEIPIFDTTLNTLTYDQLFTYNRFSGIDRIGDANQLSIGIATKFYDQETGFQKASAGIGQIIYFANRRVTLCESGTVCADYPDSPENTSRQSPISGVLTYNLTPEWSASANTIWNTESNHLDNQTVTIQYADAKQRLIALNYTYVRNGDKQLSQISANNLSQTDLSFSWPLTRDISTVGRWTEDWNQTRFHNLLYGLQYDTCCWAIRIVTGRTFDSLVNGTYQYNTEFFIQFALKGLGSFGSGNPGQALNNSLIANEASFGQDF